MVKKYETLAEFKKAAKTWVTENDTLAEHAEEDQDIWDDFADKLDFDSGELWDDFANNKYTKLIDKEVEATWQRKRSKLARVLK